MAAIRLNKGLFCLGILPIAVTEGGKLTAAVPGFISDIPGAMVRVGEGHQGASAAQKTYDAATIAGAPMMGSLGIKAGPRVRDSFKAWSKDHGPAAAREGRYTPPDFRAEDMGALAKELEAARGRVARWAEENAGAARYDDEAGRLVPRPGAGPSEMAFIEDANARPTAGEEELKFYQDNMAQEREFFSDPENNPWVQEAKHPVDHPTAMQNAPDNDMFANPKEGAGITAAKELGRGVPLARDEAVQEIRSVIDKHQKHDGHEYDYYGLRITEEPLEVGKGAPNSRVWDDGEPTQDMRQVRGLAHGKPRAALVGLIPTAM